MAFTKCWTDGFVHRFFVSLGSTTTPLYFHFFFISILLFNRQQASRALKAEDAVPPFGNFL
jgi:hypothetical protein